MFPSFIYVPLALLLFHLSHQSHALGVPRPAVGSRSESTKEVSDSGVGTLHRRQYYYLGGSYSGNESTAVMHGQMYVERLTPAKVTQPYPLLFVHGYGQTGTNWLNTPDGRLGWADFYMSQGFQVYIVDQPARGRSPWSATLDGPVSGAAAILVEQRFTATQLYGIWPQARLHTQWVGNGSIGDETFEAYYSSVVPSLSNETNQQVMVKAVAEELLLSTGKAIVVTHSQSGAYGWILADARPDLIAHILALEPTGPPFQEAVFTNSTARPYGLTEIPVSYSPPITSGADLSKNGTNVVYDEQTGDAFTCFKQTEGKVRKMDRVGKVGVTVVTGEASWHAVFEQCTVNYLVQAGVNATLMRLEDEGFHGNGHMIFMEKNQQDIARHLLKHMRSLNIAI